MRFNFDTLQFEDINFEPGKLAIVGSDCDVSWKELREKVEQLCEKFKEAGIPQGHPVCIYGHKEHLFAVAMLACIKSKLPYVPIDRVIPPERIKKIKESTGSEILVCCGEANTDFDFSMVINNSMQLSIHKQADFKEVYWIPADPVVYIMFTSGSTGEPKGVMISYEAVKSFVRWMKKDYGFSKSTVFMNQASFSFDISLYDILGAFDNGATAVLNDIETAKASSVFIGRIKKYGCTVWVSTPSFIYMYLSEPSFSKRNLPALTNFVLLGEPLTAHVVKKIYENFPGSKVYNAYGPTEATVATTLIEITPDILEQNSSSLPIGYSKYDGKILIQNAENDPSLEGELIIVGNHVSIGYLKNEKLNHEKFFTYEGVRAYKTGDYGFYKNGMVFFMGRKDDQVKLNGYRIELDEITAHLLNTGFINDAVTIPLISGGQVKKIVSFIKILKGISELNAKLTAQIIACLAKTLPTYMIPSDFRFVDEFPVNSNHKIDELKLLEWYMK